MTLVEIGRIAAGHSTKMACAMLQAVACAMYDDERTFPIGELPC